MNAYINIALASDEETEFCDASEKTLEAVCVSLLESIVTFDTCTVGGKEQKWAVPNFTYGL